MKHTVTLRNGVMLDALITVFEKKGFIRIGKKVFKVIGYRPGPGVVNWDCEFDLEDYIEGQTADAMVILPADTPHVAVRPTWNGPEDGLPPVGLEVQAYFHADTNPDWLSFTLKYLSEETAVFKGPIGEVSMSRKAFDHYGFKFRPTPNAEQLAAEAHRAKYMRQLIKLWDADTDRAEFLEAVYALIVQAEKP